MENRQIEHHPLEPFLPRGAKILMLGSFPPAHSRWSMEFYYPNMQNDMWRIVGLIFYDDRNHFISGKCFDRQRICAFCTSRGIAISDTARSVVRLNNTASDKFLEIVEATDIKQLIEQLPDCKAIVTTGQKATDTLCANLSAPEPKIGSYCEFTTTAQPLRLYRMPSTSRAYPMPLEQKAEAYRQLFVEVGLLK